MKENWGKRGMPPQVVDVLHRQPHPAGSPISEKVFIKGWFPWWGKPHAGWNGQETIIFREKRKDGWAIVKHNNDEYKS